MQVNRFFAFTICAFSSLIISQPLAQDKIWILSKKPLWSFECHYAFTAQTDESFARVCTTWQEYITTMYNQITAQVTHELGIPHDLIIKLTSNHKTINGYLEFLEKKINTYLPLSTKPLDPLIAEYVRMLINYLPPLPSITVHHTTEEKELSYCQAVGAYEQELTLILSSHFNKKNISTIHENYNNSTCTYIAVDHPNIHLARCISVAGFLHFDILQAYTDCIHQTDFFYYLYSTVQMEGKKISQDTLDRIYQFFIIRKFIESTLNSLNPLEIALFFIDAQPFVTYKQLLLPYLKDLSSCYHEETLQIIYSNLLEKKQDILRPESE